MTGIDWSALYPTPVRVKLLQAINEDRGRIYCDSTGVHDHDTGQKVTARLRDMLAAGWVRVRTNDDPKYREEWSTVRTYYRVTDLGRAAIERGRR